MAFTVFLPNFLVNNFELTPVNAGMRTAGFILLATIMRPIGGWLADKFNSYILLIYIFSGITIGGYLLSFGLTIEMYTVGSLLIALCAGTGNGVVFKLVPLYLEQAGIVNGIVAMMGGLGGFFPPLMLTAFFNLTSHLCHWFYGTFTVRTCKLSDCCLDVSTRKKIRFKEKGE